MTDAQKKKPMRLSYTDIQMRRDSIEMLQAEVEKERQNDALKLPVTASREKEDLLVKLLVIGDSEVGKSCLLLRFCDDSFTPSFVTTIGIDFKIRTIQLDGKRIKLQIWDTAGQERFRTITTAYYRGAMGIIFAYDVTKKESFENMHEWIEATEKHASSQVNKMLVGCKCDLEDRKTVGTKSAMQFAEQHNMQFLEASAKEDINVDRCFIDLTRRVVSRVLTEREEYYAEGASQSIRVHNTPRGGGKGRDKPNCCK